MARIGGVPPFTEVPITPAAKEAAKKAAEAAGKKPVTPPNATRPANNGGDSIERSTPTEGKKKGALRQFLEDIAPFIQDKP